MIYTQEILISAALMLAVGVGVIFFLVYRHNKMRGQRKRDVLLSIYRTGMLSETMLIAIHDKMAITKSASRIEVLNIIDELHMEGFLDVVPALSPIYSLTEKGFNEVHEEGNEDQG